MNNVAIIAPGELSTERVDLSDAARAFASEALAESTRRRYASHWRAWLEHCEDCGLSPFPAAPEAVANWLAERANEGERGGKRAKIEGRGHSLSTLRNAVAAIKSVHSAKGVHFDTSSPAISMVLKGVPRVKAEVPSQAAPLRAGLITDVIGGLGDAPLELRDAALLSLGYCFAKRRSELVGLDLGQLGSGDGVLVIDEKWLSIILVRHKTQTGEPLRSVVPREGNEILVSAVERWLAVAQVRPGQAILRYVSRWGTVSKERLDGDSVARIVKKRMREFYMRQGDTVGEAKLKADRFSGHSLRVGFVVSSAEAGADVRSIMTVTGHKTPAMAVRYSAAADLERSSPYRLQGVGLGATKDEPQT